MELSRAAARTPCSTQSRTAVAEAVPESETQSKPATRPGVFEEPWDASFFRFAISDTKSEPWLMPQVRCNCKWIQLGCASLGDLDLLLVELYLATNRSASPS